MSERRLITLALFVATFLVALDTSVVSTAMPTVIGQIGGIQLYGWVFSAYLVAINPHSRAGRMVSGRRS